MAPATPLGINPSLRILRVDTGDGGAVGAMAVATSSAKRLGKKALGSPKISNNFETAVQHHYHHCTRWIDEYVVNFNEKIK